MSLEPIESNSIIEHCIAILVWFFRIKIKKIKCRTNTITQSWSLFIFFQIQKWVHMVHWWFIAKWSLVRLRLNGFSHTACWSKGPGPLSSMVIKKLKNLYEHSATVLSYQADPLGPSFMWLWMSKCHFTQWFLNIHQSGYTYSAVVDMAHATWNCCHLGASSVYTIQPCISLQCDFIRSHKCRVHVSSAVTCQWLCQTFLRLVWHL